MKKCCNKCDDKGEPNYIPCNECDCHKKIFMICKSYGSLFSDDIIIEASDKQKAIVKFCEKENIKYKKIVYDWENSRRKYFGDGQLYPISIQQIEIREGRNCYAYSKNSRILGKGYYLIIV